MNAKPDGVAVFKRLNEPWVYATIGSLLIITSTVATGFCIYKTSNEIDGLRAGIARSNERLERSERHSDHADLISTLHVITRNLADNVADEKLRAAMQHWGIVSEVQATEHRAWTAGKESFDTSLLKKAQALQSRGDNSGYLMLLDQQQELFDAEFRYKEHLRLEIEQNEKQIQQLEHSRNFLSLIALVCQVVGLVFLLFKDVRASRAG